MGQAWIDGKPVALEAAIARAAELLAASRFPVFAGLGTDVAGTRAAVALARRLRGAIDHMNSSPYLRDLDVMREAGMMLTTPAEVRLRADTLLLVGPALVARWPELPAVLFAPVENPRNGARRVTWLCPPRDAKKLVPAELPLQTVGRNPEELAPLVAMLRARVAGRNVGKGPASVKVLDALAADLQTTPFGVAVWSADDLDALTIQMLCGLVSDLNAGTRFTGLSLSQGDNAIGVSEVCGWLTGFPVRTGFGRDLPEHDPWRFEATRLVDSGEADCAVWIASYRAAGPPWQRNVSLIALSGEEASFRRPPLVHIAVGCPGIDHDCVEHNAMLRTLAQVKARAPRETVSVADALADIDAALLQNGAASC
jgi:formylmethanofuran dehydrogenase subunit B